ncbi:hypothetical protein CTA1_4783 [Colletotrichum tanaceti]|uniref:Uncharacterized protein n=1 Tax=Colletotrichum tanaceti TaxID=1306861 RepID=A0A4U6XVW8_9PEZI|nr:hypothetical protein CTA1_4783 [Colletotrichum tanaceti]
MSRLPPAEKLPLALRKNSIYVSSAIYNLKTFASNYGDDGKSELNSICHARSLILDLDDRPKNERVTYCGVVVRQGGKLALVFAEGNLGTNADYALDASGLLKALNDAPPAPGSDESLSFAARTSVRQEYDEKIEETRQKLADMLEKPDVVLVPNFEANFAKILEAGKKKGSEVREDWEGNMGGFTRMYFEGLEYQMTYQKFGDDDMLREGFNEAVDKGEIHFRIVDKMAYGAYGEVVLEDGAVYVQARAHHFGTNDAANDRASRVACGDEPETQLPSINLCKTVMSAAALGYPMPTLLKWNGEFNRPDWHFAGSHIAKLESLLAAIDRLYEREDDDHVNEDDLVPLVDAYDVWFQLPPSVLIQRFHQINRKADARVRKQWEEGGLKPGFPVAPPTQSVLVITAKDCQPDRESGSEPRYEYWPDSPLRPHFYGNDTDRVLTYGSDSARKYKKLRPRCVNSGMIMSTAGSLRSALRKCRAKVDAAAARGRQLWSDQALLAEVIGDQEVWRHWVRGLAPEWNGFVSRERLEERPGELPPRRIADAALAGEEFEFGIGLDYDFATIPPTCSSEDDGYFVRLDDAEGIRRASDKAGVPGGEVRVKGIIIIPPELEELAAPTTTTLLPGHVGGWGNVSLYTDFFFGTSPVGIHHNAYVFGLKAWRLENWWNMTWFHPRLRELVTASLGEGSNKKLAPLARLPLEPDGRDEMVYWASDEGPAEAGVRVFDGSKEAAGYSAIGWDGICQKGDRKWHDVVFGDGKGPLAV